MGCAKRPRARRRQRSTQAAPRAAPCGPFPRSGAGLSARVPATASRATAGPQRHSKKRTAFTSSEFTSKRGPSMKPFLEHL
jgi:hypothetical protein